MQLRTSTPICVRLNFNFGLGYAPGAFPVVFHAEVTLSPVERNSTRSRCSCTSLLKVRFRCSCFEAPHAQLGPREVLREQPGLRWPAPMGEAGPLEPAATSSEVML